MGRRLVLVAASSTIAAAAVFACGSDDLLSGIDLDAGLGLLDGSAQKDATPSDDGGSTEDPTLDSGTITLPDGAVVLPDGGPVDPTTGCQTCDCDGDGYNRPGCGDNKGTDCDDLDSNVHPNAGFGTASPGKDLNCSGVIEKQYPVGVTCVAAGLGCAAPEGFTTDPRCGQSATYVSCAPAVIILGCKPDGERDAYPGVPLRATCRAALSYRRTP